MKHIAFIGTGVMGSSIVKHILKANYPVTIHTRTKQKAEQVISSGAKWAATVKEAIQGADVIFTMVGMPTDVEEIYLGKDGILKNGVSGQILVDMTTSSPALAIKIEKAAAEKGMYSIDAPVSGGDIGAQNGTLSIMCGGTEDVFTQVQSLFSLFGSQVILQGPPGAGQHTKMSNQLAIATNMIGVCEAIIYAEQAGLDPERVLESISGGAAGSWSLANLGPRMLENDFEPGFYTKHFLKDLRIALDEASSMNVDLPGLQLAISFYEDLVAKGYGDKGTQVLYKRYK